MNRNFGDYPPPELDFDIPGKNNSSNSRKNTEDFPNPECFGIESNHKEYNVESNNQPSDIFYHLISFSILLSVMFSYIYFH